MKTRQTLCAILAGFAMSVGAEQCAIEIDAGKTLAKARRAELMGINIAVYNSSKEYEAAIRGPLADLDIALVRMPGGSVSDKYYWNGNGVVRPDGTIDQSKFSPFEKQGYWKIDWSGYAPGFAVGSEDWSKANPDFIRMDAKSMHEITRMHPLAHNLVTANLGTGKPEMAAEWVRWANLENDYDVTYWELGNELNGDWEAGHVTADGTLMNAEEYVRRFVAFSKAMKAVDPSIKIGGPACDEEHHDDYFEPLLRDAGDLVDVLTFHYYSLRSSLASEKELFAGLDKLGPVAGRLRDLVKKYQPERTNEIEYCITEWNSKLPKDQDAYRLFNGLWFSAWIGEMMKHGIDSATVWDLFSTPREGGHGLLVRKGEEFVPTGRYWAFWLWSHFMGDELLAIEGKTNADVRVYATREGNSLFLMAMNESRTNVHSLSVSLKNFDPAPEGRVATLSSREYFWNPYRFVADWNSGPSISSFRISRPICLEIPPYSVRVWQFVANGRCAEMPAPSKPLADAPAELRLLLPESRFCDLKAEGWVRAFGAGSDRPCGKDPTNLVELSVEGPATISPSRLPLSGSTAKFILLPEGKPGKVVVTARCGSLTASRPIELEPVELTDYVAWNFDDGQAPASATTPFSYVIADAPAKTNDKALRIDLDGRKIQEPQNHLLDLNAYPRGVPKARIGGVRFDLFLPKSLSGIDDPAANLQPILQSTGAYWIPCGSKPVNDLPRGEWITVRMELPDKNFLPVMDRAFALLFLGWSEKPVSGSIYLDNVGFLLRPKK